MRTRLDIGSTVDANRSVITNSQQSFSGHSCLGARALKSASMLRVCS